MKLEIKGTGIHPQNYKVLMDGHDVTSCILNLKLEMDGNSANKVIITVLPKEMEIDADVEAYLDTMKRKVKKDE